jgi:hypothetical protein
MGVGGETVCDMTQGVRATLREDILGDPAAKCLAEISDLIGSKLAEPAPHVLTREEYRMWAEICVNWARVGVVTSATISFYVILHYMPTFARVQLHLPLDQAFLAQAISLACMIVLTPLSGALSDLTGRNRL